MSGPRLPPDERRAAILQVAQDLFSRRAYADVSVADVADAADVPAPLIAFHFGSKRALYLEVLRATVDGIRAGLAEIPGPPSLERLQAAVGFYARHAATHRAGYLSFLRGGVEIALPEAAELVRTVRAEITDGMARDVAAAVPDLDAAGHARLQLAVQGHLGFVDAAVTHWLGRADDAPDLDPDAIAQLAVGAFTGALASVLATRSDPVS
jgi:AcrR family transcriptional regulator